MNTQDIQELRDYLKKYRFVGQSADWSVDAWQLTPYTVLTVDDEDENWSYISTIDHGDIASGRAWQTSCEGDMATHIQLILEELERINWNINAATNEEIIAICTANAEANVATQQIEHGGDPEQTAINHGFEVL